MPMIIPPQKGANIQIGDYVPTAGIYTKPGVVIDKKEDGTVQVDTEKETIAKFHRHSNTTGLTLEEKEKFNSIMDSIMSEKNNSDRINNLQSTIDTLKVEAENKKIVMALRNEQSQLIRMSKELPRIYNADMDLVR